MSRQEVNQLGCSPHPQTDTEQRYYPKRTFPLDLLPTLWAQSKGNMKRRTERSDAGWDKSEVEVVPTQAGYDRWAEVYDREDNPLVLLEEMHIGPLAGKVTGLAVADIGCGTGRHALRWAAAGARVTAVDFSDAMLQRARAKPGAGADRKSVV